MPCQNACRSGIPSAFLQGLEVSLALGAFTLYGKSSTNDGFPSSQKKRAGEEWKGLDRD
ncbi:hypothetical protein NITMOv2_4506 [Nitrospira moscoviensis]|uniref:Uncharacterized protein n=1 Tax=Nitrospira moscoviensis TaxID=42253 RepID=A0A0K2GIW2_NITMO|nr:hypothetical protein NITMOv2_4506 [Nitrospira moscoviensis]